MICPVRAFSPNTTHLFTGNWLKRFNMKPHYYKPPYLTECTCGNNWWKCHFSIFGSFSGIIFVKPAKKYPKIIFQENDEKLKHYVNHVKYHEKLSFKCITI